MNTLEVLYADRAKHLTDDSPDKAEIEDLKHNKLKVFYTENILEELTEEEMADVIANKYDVLKCAGYTYYAYAPEDFMYFGVSSEENAVKFVFYDDGAFRINDIHIGDIMHKYVSESGIDSLTDDDIKSIATGKYISVEADGEQYIVGQISDQVVMFTQFGHTQSMPVLVWCRYVCDDNVWTYDDDGVISFNQLATKTYVDENKGTKLYRHRIFTQSSYVYEINVLSTSNENMKNLLTSGTIKLFNNGVLQIYANDKLYTQIYSYGGSSAFTDAGGNMSNYNDLGTVSDTVTEL